MGCMPGFGDGGAANTWIIIFMLCLIVLFVYFQKTSESLHLVNTVAKCDDWWSILNSVIMVLECTVTTVINQTQGAKIGADILEHYKHHHSDTSLKDVIAGTCNNTGLVGALLFSCAVGIVVTTPDVGDTCGFASQVYWNFSFTALGTSFYGMVCAVSALVYSGGLTDEDMAKYVTDFNNIKGIGASVTSTLSSGLFMILAAAIYGWQNYGMSLGIGALFGLNSLFIGISNKLAYQSKWDPNDTDGNQHMDTMNHIRVPPKSNETVQPKFPSASSMDMATGQILAQAKMTLQETGPISDSLLLNELLKDIGVHSAKARLDIIREHKVVESRRGSSSKSSENNTARATRQSATVATGLWTKHSDTASGKPYWHNEKTGVTTWDKPDSDSPMKAACLDQPEPTCSTVAEQRNC